MIASTRHTIILLVILAAITFATFAANSKRSPGTHVNRVALYLSIAAGEWLLARYAIGGLRGITARELIGPFRWFDVPLAAVFLAAAVTLLFLVQRAVGPQQNRMTGLLPITLPEKVAWIVVSLTAAFVEEVVFRGYLQRQCIAWTRNAAAGIVIQAVIFAAAHVYQGWKSTMAIAVYGVLIGLLAYYRRSLVPGMLAHAVADAAAIMRPVRAFLTL